jgi:excisionase family DNA binding protein
MIDKMPLLTYQECADRLHVSPATARRLARTGRLEVLRLTPQTHRIRESALQSFLEQGCTASASGPQEAK